MRRPWISDRVDDAGRGRQARDMRKGVIPLLLALAFAPRAAAAATYAVGPGRPHPDLQSVAPLLKPGDRVELDGAATYRGDLILDAAGTKDAKITIVGKRINGLRPILAGGVTTVEVRANHYVLEGLEIKGGSARCFFHHADDVTLRDSVIHDCPSHGILGADSDAGSLTLSYVEVYRCGRGDQSHSIYMATDEEEYPRSVFRMEHCFIHDSTGGNSVKSRAERNEIYSNWIEGALYHELELIGPDGAERKRAREDSDVVGNVIRKAGRGYAIRVGGDGTGETNGRYRFVNNTIVLARGARAVFRLFDGLECIQMHNNAIAHEGGGPVHVVIEEQVHWAAGRPVITGSNNWIPMGSSGVPPTWARTLAGRDPGFVSDVDLRPAAGSPLIGAGTAAPEQPPRFEFPAPLSAPRALPPLRTLERVGTARSRLRGTIDIGAFSYGDPTPPKVDGAPPRPSAPPPSKSRGEARGGCGCRSAGASERSGAPSLAIAVVAAMRWRRARRHRR
ncbi:Hypothetical protein A7982_10435 [Minicystis rosea]|nr:Hypothetical protein A7982_10435 [Minicystis rosea]